MRVPLLILLSIGLCPLTFAVNVHVSKTEYLDLMEAAVSSYSAGHIREYIAEVERDGVQEHGFPRLAANLGVLVANGRMREKRDLLREMMTISCRDAPKGAMKLPAFAFDGEHETEISCVGTTLTVRYRGWICVYETDGTLADTGKTCGNRNGRYRMFEARGAGRVRVKVAIVPFARGI